MRAHELHAIVRGLAGSLGEVFKSFGDRLAALEQKERGLDGKDGPAGPPGPQGPIGRDGLTGREGQKGADGRDGVDGFSLDDFQVRSEDGGRTLEFVFQQGDRTKSSTVKTWTVLDRGVYRADVQYERGDGVTFGGSFWIAQAETTARPGDGATPWRLAVKKGGEGREGRQGPTGPQGPKGDRGHDGRNYQ